MTVYVFTGPTLAPAAAREHLDAIYLPPAAQGDVYRVARRRPVAIGLIDGYYDTVPAVWHKEILWALSEGIAVFGSASMGALRGAELAAFGMRGVGRIFEAFRDGELEDDDEVALAHEPEASGYRSLSTPMVNIRATLRAAVDAGVLGAETRDALVQRVKGWFYPDRTYRRIVAECGALGFQAEMEQLVAWLPEGQVDAKRADAIAMLAAIRIHLEAGGAPVAPAFHFEHTTFWDGLCRNCDDAPDETRESPAASPRWRDVLDELRLDADQFDRVRTRALNHAFGRLLESREGQRIDVERLERALAEFRAARGLVAPTALEAWLAAHDLDPASLSRFLEEEAVMRWAWTPAELERRVADELRFDEAYPALRSRALEKRALLASIGLAEPGPADTRLSRAALIEWYFGSIGQVPPPDLDARVQAAGFADQQTFLRAIAREFLYREKEANRPKSGD